MGLLIGKEAAGTDTRGNVAGVAERCGVVVVVKYGR